MMEWLCETREIARWLFIALVIIATIFGYSLCWALNKNNGVHVSGTQSTEKDDK